MKVLWIFFYDHSYQLWNLLSYSNNISLERHTNGLTHIDFLWLLNTIWIIWSDQTGFYRKINLFPLSSLVSIWTKFIQKRILDGAKQRDGCAWRQSINEFLLRRKWTLTYPYLLRWRKREEDSESSIRPDPSQRSEDM